MERVLYAPRALPPLPPDVSQDPGPYEAWSRDREERRVRATSASRRARLRLVMAVADADPAAVNRTLHALRRQRGGWSLTVVAAEDRLAEVRALVHAGTALRDRRRVHLLGAGGPGSERDLLGIGIEAGRGLARALLFPGDVWSPDAVAWLSAALTPTTVVYADEDEQLDGGGALAPRLKPDFSPEFLLTSGYIGRPFAMGADVADHLPRLVASGTGALEHECALAATELADAVVHIPEVLCHRTTRDDPTTASLPAADLEAVLRHRQDPAAVTSGPAPGLHRLVRPARTDVPVSIVIPFRDAPRLLRTCVDSVVATTDTHSSVELVLIDNGSTDPETLTLMERLSDNPDVRVVSDPRPFNWAALNNAGALQARGDILLFLNNDIEAQRSGWLTALCSQAMRPDVAVAGARLLYPDRRLQHCGLVVGLTGAAGHVLGGLDEPDAGYLHMAVTARECSAVTGACFATRRDVFELLEGFDEGLGVDLNDVDYCLRAATKGLRTMYEPAAELIHHESPSRGTAGGGDDVLRFLERWKGYIAEGDRYLNPHLTRADPSCRLAGPGEKDDWNRWFATLTMQ
ncbi:MAG: glycosyltransferase family 2 protein [Acidimicrobiales bacterium]